MTTAIHFPFPLNNNFPTGLFDKLISSHPSDKFILFSHSASLNDAPNLTTVIISKKTKTALSRYLWSAYTLPKLLKKYQADVLIVSPEMYCERCELPQYVFFNDSPRVFIHALNKKSIKTFINNLRAATGIFLPENIYKAHCTEDLLIAPTSLHVYQYLKFKSSEIPVDFKEKYAAGNEYFLFSVDASSEKYLMLLLKAFSIFKKRQKSSMKLIIVDDRDLHTLVKDFKNYKFRDDVISIPQQNNGFENALRSAYTVIYCEDYKVNNSALKALHSRVPLIATDNNINRLLFGTAAIYADVQEKALAEAMMLLYKDEYEKSRLVAEGQLLSSNYSEENAACVIWNAVSVNKNVND